VIVGDEDETCLDGSMFLKRTAPTAALLVIPRSGHTITSEEPAVVNAALAELLRRRRHKCLTGVPIQEAQTPLVELGHALINRRVRAVVK